MRQGTTPDASEVIPEGATPENPNWSRGLDQHAGMLDFSHVARAKCDYCKNECELPPCATCGTHVCIECYESGQHHEICAGNATHSSWINNGLIPTEPNKGRANVATKYLFSEDTPAMRQILCISRSNQERIRIKKAEEEEKARKAGDLDQPRYGTGDDWPEEAKGVSPYEARIKAEAEAALARDKATLSEIRPADSVSQVPVKESPKGEVSKPTEPSLLTGREPRTEPEPPLDLGPADIKVPKLYTVCRPGLDPSRALRISFCLENRFALLGGRSPHPL